MNHLLTELRRRNVFRVAAAYLVVGWLLIQLAALLETSLGLPEWFDAAIIGFLIIGMPIALLLAWAFEMTPEGMKKTESVADPGAFKPLGPSDYVLIAGVLVVLGVVGFQTMGQSNAEQTVANAPAAETTIDQASSPDASETSVVEAETTEAPISEASIAVLPFADFSQDGDQQYFSDGIAEELLNALAQFPDLRVAARTSAFSFRGDDVDLREVGEALGVAHVLEGSVRQSGDQLRITAQLIRASDGYHLWSQTYERTLTDVFEIQDDIVRELSRVLQVRLGVGGGAGRARLGGINPQAYEQYLRGLSLWGNRDTDDNRENAISAFQLATELDPSFADAWAAYGISVMNSALSVHGMDIETATRVSSNAFSRALEIDPDNARAHAGLGWFHTNWQPDLTSALAHSALAIEIAPNAAYAHYARGALLSWTGDYQASARSYRRALSLDPLNNTVALNFADDLMVLGDGNGAVRAIEQCAECPEIFAEYLRFNALVPSSSEEEILNALLELIPVLREAMADLPEEARNVEVAEFSDQVDLILGIEGAGELVRADIDEDIENDEIDFDTVVYFALLGEGDAAANAIYSLYGSEEFSDLTDYLLPGRRGFPETLRRHPRYHEFWELPGMPELAAARRANGQTAGLPLPIEGGE